MPGKKFKAPNSKAEAARERKETAKREVEERKKKEEEDKFWQDDDKHASRKQERKADKERKKQEQLDKKAAAKKLLEEEESKLPGKTASGAGKVTRAQIAETQSRQRAQAEACALPKGVSEPLQLDVNPNQIMRERALEGHVDAETVDEAIAALRISQPAVERHPERRLKASYAAFEEKELPRLKAENPNLRMSQVKQLIRKEWMRSPENPMNQPHARYDSKS